MNDNSNSEGSKPRTIQPGGTLTEQEIEWVRHRLPEIEARMEQSAKETPTDPCWCGRHLLKPSWAAITDGPTWSIHRRADCKDKDRPTACGDKEWSEILAARQARDAASAAP